MNIFGKEGEEVKKQMGFRLDVPPICQRCGKLLRGYIEFNEALQLIGCTGFSIFPEGVICDDCMLDEFHSTNSVP